MMMTLMNLRPMKIRSEKKITTFEELNAAKIELANSISQQEDQILNNPLFSTRFF